jgi:hypothetical protein
MLKSCSVIEGYLIGILLLPGPRWTEEQIHWRCKDDVGAIAPPKLKHPTISL